MPVQTPSEQSRPPPRVRALAFADVVLLPLAAMFLTFFRDAWRENRTLVRVLLVTLSAVTLAWVVYALVGHRLIDSIYRGESLQFLGRAFEDRDTRSVESYYERVDTLLIHLSAYFLIATVTMASLLARPRNAVALRLWLLVVAPTVIVTMTLVKPIFYGDGPEYLTMSESMTNHLTPDLREGDLEHLQGLEKEFGFSFSRRNPRQYYFESKDGAYYSYHFWLYSAVNVPLQAALRVLRANEAKVFQITNAILLVLALCHIVFWSAFSNTQRWLFAFLTTFCPAFWFLHWPHPEVFSFSLVVFSLAHMSRRRWNAAVFWAAVASTQNQPLVLFVALLWIRGVMASRRRGRDAAVLALAGLPVLLPNLFFYVHYHTASLLAREAASVDNIGVRRALELFFDPNIGMLPYLPLAVLVFVALLARDIYSRRWSSSSVQFAPVLLLMALACTPTYLWNHGTTGPSRYVIWMLPLLFFSLVEAVEEVRKTLRRMYVGVIGTAALWQAVVVVAIGGFTPPLTQMSHTRLARFVLDHAPALYNPTPEIFAVRTSHHMPEITYSPATGYRAELPPTPIVYRREGRCRKALIVGNEWNELEEMCGTEVSRPASRTLGKAMYVNFD